MTLTRPRRLLSRLVLGFIAAALLLAPEIAAARPIPTGKALRVRDGVQHDCRAEDLNAAPFAAPGSAHRWGTVVVGCFKDGHARLEEWDLYAGRPLRRIDLPTPSGDDQIRVAHGSGHTLVVLSEALQGGGETRVLLLDDTFKLKRSWKLAGSDPGDFADVAADGALAVVVARSTKGARVLAVDLAHERVTARRLISAHDKLVMITPNRPAHGLRVHGGDVYLALQRGDTLHVLRLDSKLRTRAAYVRRQRGVGAWYSPGQFWIALDRGHLLLAADHRIVRLDRSLRHAAPVRRARSVPPFNGPARWAISPAGQVATEDGRIAAAANKPFARVLDFTDEVVVRGLKREIRANATRSVFWAFGRAVIVRSALNVGITAIQPR